MCYASDHTEGKLLVSPLKALCRDIRVIFSKLHVTCVNTDLTRDITTPPRLKLCTELKKSVWDFNLVGVAMSPMTLIY